ncbi:nucleoside triphosphate pyrophosphohydrolase [Treponema pedis]|uniref:nucleoside triphosphate pyrophosphohydrolase n=1 Tax=Treponema pedis TaxID=409322 RepID=UPI0019825618|nr:nucleoside triphosphate pyrophosphohydrolase [Treponema pedis]QSI04875.1 nucleoside triphosphate pyrophosphohydrolase [Treponema pedis]
MTTNNLLNNFDILFGVIKRLRGKGGCPWDIAQTPSSMRRPLLEEAYEAADAIEETVCKNGETSFSHIREELGDVLLNTLMISYMYEQEGKFSTAEVIADVTEKLIRRHPHVFGETEGYEGPESEKKVSTPDSVLKQWENIKETVENSKNKPSSSLLDGIPKNFPPILRSLKITKKVSKCGFDWDSFEGIKNKLEEEIEEFYEAVNSKIPERIEDELGDVLFILMNAARFIKTDPEIALLHANSKFEHRFRFIEKEMKKAGLKLCKENWEKMEEFWQKAKKEEKLC